MESTPVSNRDVSLDAARGAAIVALIGYHILFDLWYFDVVSFDPIVRYLAYPIAGSFIVIAGISLHLKSEYIRRRRSDYQRYTYAFFKRGGLLLVIGAGITLATWIYPHEGFIIWGILHLIGAGTILAIPFIHLGRWNVLAAALIIIIWLIFFPVYGPDYLMPFGIYSQELYTLDYWPLIPWFSLILIGIACGSALYPEGVITRTGRGTVLQVLAIPGRHSLLIYLAHQPIIIGLLAVTGIITL
ncbi:heparan-alpha-glucosaminide N-acetyltransferase [Methanocalculus sp. MSAO_Arc2]|uniref:heparan-alpha-glucosaminide N-acetyltransferase n=1 Tax=Methanocalculus sp. MSAO_Arc2 TaxID=2293855 RepID=UPI002697E621